VRCNFPAEIKAEFPVDAMHARCVPAASPSNRPIRSNSPVYCNLHLEKSSNNYLPTLATFSYMLTFLRSLRFLLNSSLVRFCGILKIIFLHFLTQKSSILSLGEPYSTSDFHALHASLPPTAEVSRS